MKKIILSVLILTSCSCGFTKMQISGSKYSTGHMGMPGENVFVFKDGNQFYYYERLSYSEGTFEWIDEKQIKLTSKKMGFDIPYKETRCYRDLSGKIVIFKRNNLLFEGFILKHVKKGIQDETRTMGKL